MGMMIILGGSKVILETEWGFHLCKSHQWESVHRLNSLAIEEALKSSENAITADKRKKMKMRAKKTRFRSTSMDKTMFK